MCIFLNKKFFILLYVSYSVSILSMEQVSFEKTMFSLSNDVLYYILDLCLKPERKHIENISHLALDYMFYIRITPSKKNAWAKEKKLFVQEYMKIGYIKNLYALYYRFKLISHDAALRINTYFDHKIQDLGATTSFFSIKTNIYIIYLFNVLSSFNYRLYHNNFQHDDRSRILHLISVNSIKKDSHLSISINTDTRQLYIHANVHHYYKCNTRKKFIFRYNKIIYPNKNVRIHFPFPIEFFDEKKCLTKSFYCDFLTFQNAYYLKYCIDSLVLEKTYSYYQNPPCVVNTRYNNIKKLADLDLKFIISYNLKESINLNNKLLY